MIYAIATFIYWCLVVAAWCSGISFVLLALGWFIPPFGYGEKGNK